MLPAITISWVEMAFSQEVWHLRGFLTPQVSAPRKKKEKKKRERPCNTCECTDVAITAESVSCCSQLNIDCPSDEIRWESREKINGYCWGIDERMSELKKTSKEYWLSFIEKRKNHTYTCLILIFKLFVMDTLVSQKKDMQDINCNTPKVPLFSILLLQWVNIVWWRYSNRHYTCVLASLWVAFHNYCIYSTDKFHLICKFSSLILSCSVVIMVFLL